MILLQVIMVDPFQTVYWQVSTINLSDIIMSGAIINPPPLLNRFVSAGNVHRIRRDVRVYEQRLQYSAITGDSVALESLSHLNVVWLEAVQLWIAGDDCWLRNLLMASSHPSTSIYIGVVVLSDRMLEVSPSCRTADTAAQWPPPALESGERSQDVLPGLALCLLAF